MSAEESQDVGLEWHSLRSAKFTLEYKSGLLDSRTESGFFQFTLDEVVAHCEGTRWLATVVA
jgi:hypothetical protein